MEFAFENIMDFTMNFDMLVLANLLGEMMDEIMEFQIFWPSENYKKALCTKCVQGNVKILNVFVKSPSGLVFSVHAKYKHKLNLPSSLTFS